MNFLKLIKHFTKFELFLWIFSLISILVVSILSKSNFLNIFSSLIGVTSLIFIAKGYPFGQFLVCIFAILYGIISLSFSYYGEMITYVFMSLPIAFVTGISWLRHPFKKGESEVKVEKIVSSSTKGFTLTYDLADELNLPYKIDTIYTNTLKSQITTNNEIVSLSSKEDLIKTFDTFMEIMNLMIYVLVLFSSLLAFVVLYNLGTMSYIERYRELATLKVLGFKNSKIRWILTSQNIFTTLIGIIIGCPIGYVTLVGLYKALASEYELSIVCSWYVYFISIIITFLVSLIVSYFTSLKVKKINMVEALKAE